MTSRERIVFIDDEPFFARSYVEKLEQDYNVIYNDNVEDGLQSVRNQNDLRLLILDIMMPSPASVSGEDTEQGLGTGLWILRQILPRVQNRNRPLPVCILTNRKPNIVVEAVTKLGIGEELVVVRHKSDTPAFYLPRLVRQLIDR